jgi:XTP/dITP diphosphohydrolase
MKQRIVLASNNLGKVLEIAKVLAPFHVDITPQSAFNVPEVAETAVTFIENALIKARHASLLTGLPALADDSGLEVDALNGAPGIYSARYAGEKVPASAHINKLLAALALVKAPQRTARFYCVMVLLRYPDDPTPLVCQGSWNGVITTQPQGNQGFGYDPIFYLPTHHCTAAQLTLDVKNTVSHRGQALQQLLDRWPNYR